MPASIHLSGLGLAFKDEAKKKSIIIRTHQITGRYWIHMGHTEHEWQMKYQTFKQYIKDNGNSTVSARHPLVGKWVTNQRTLKRTGQLSEERIRLLDEIGFIWDASNN